MQKITAQNIELGKHVINVLDVSSMWVEALDCPVACPDPGAALVIHMRFQAAPLRLHFASNPEADSAYTYVSGCMSMRELMFGSWEATRQTQQSSQSSIPSRK